MCGGERRKLKAENGNQVRRIALGENTAQRTRWEEEGGAEGMEYSRTICTGMCAYKPSTNAVSSLLLLLLLIIIDTDCVFPIDELQNE